MRRTDREMDREFGIGVIDSSDYGIVSVNNTKNAYSVPLSIVRDENTLYFHSGKQGTKTELFLNDTNATVVFVGKTHIPENFTKDELDEMSHDSSKAVQFISQVFTTEFESAIVKGKISKVTEQTEKISALRLICEKYTPSKMEYFDIAIKAGLDKTNIYSIEIEELTAKRKKYDGFGKEMKWGRLDE